MIPQLRRLLGPTSAIRKLTAARLAMGSPVFLQGFLRRRIEHRTGDDPLSARVLGLKIAERLCIRRFHATDLLPPGTDTGARDEVPATQRVDTRSCLVLSEDGDDLLHSGSAALSKMERSSLQCFRGEGHSERPLREPGDPHTSRQRRASHATTGSNGSWARSVADLPSFSASRAVNTSDQRAHRGASRANRTCPWRPCTSLDRRTGRRDQSGKSTGLERCLRPVWPEPVVCPGNQHPDRFPDPPHPPRASQAA